jgi:threonine/homoserine/homoserine lactone efflux protein
MLELVLSAIILGFMLSLVFIGPIFFLLIETSFSRGPKHALSLDLGVITADLLCIVAAYYASADIVTLIDKHPGFYRITSILIFVYGIVMLVTKTKCICPVKIRSLAKIILKPFLMVFSLIF